MPRCPPRELPEFFPPELATLVRDDAGAPFRSDQPLSCLRFDRPASRICADRGFGRIRTLDPSKRRARDRAMLLSELAAIPDIAARRTSPGPQKLQQRRLHAAATSRNLRVTVAWEAQPGSTERPGSSTAAGREGRCAGRKRQVSRFAAFARARRRSSGAIRRGRDTGRRIGADGRPGGL